MKNLKLFILILLCVKFSGSYSQTLPEVDSKEYQDLKSKNIIPQKEEKEYKGRYLKLNTDKNKGKKSSTSDDFSINSLSSFVVGCPVEDPSSDPSFMALPANDDGSTGLISLPFNFNFFGQIYTSLYVNNNGNISFGTSYGAYTSTGFPSSYNMIAPFWADVDTRGVGNGLVYYKVESNRFTVIWYKVGYYYQNTSKLNTFKLVISDGSDPSIGIGNNVAIIYDDMQWTTGDASSGVNGLGGVPATVGMNRAQTGNNCFFYQLGRFGKSGYEYIDATTTSGVDYLDYKCFYYDVSEIKPVEMDFSVDQYQCGLFVRPEITNLSGCDFISVEWDFGDGTFYSELSPIHAYQDYGTYTVNLTTQFSCGACGTYSSTETKTINLLEQSVVFEDSVINLSSNEKLRVLNASAINFFDSWPRVKDVSNLASFYNGASGIWRPETVYFYDEVRSNSTTIDISKDGTFSMDDFNWEQELWGQIPNWHMINSVTRYNQEGFQQEKKDVLGIYSSEIYDYKGELLTAQAMNSRFLETAYTGFEMLDDYSSGNWQLGKAEMPVFQEVKVVMGNRYFAVVEASMDQLSAIDTVMLFARINHQGDLKHAARKDVPILCREPYDLDPKWSVLVLGISPADDIWTGSIYFKKQAITSDLPVIDGTYAHTGNSSLKVSGEKAYPQGILKLDSAKIYHVSAWMSIKQTPSIPHFGEGVGIDLEFLDIEGNIIGTYFYQPSGPIIELWQQVKGDFIYPAGAESFSIKFNSGNHSNIWVDDLRLFPEDGGMQSYVYDPKSLRLSAVLDDENFGTYYYYDDEGNLFMVKKETAKGIKTLSEIEQYQIER